MPNSTEGNYNISLGTSAGRDADTVSYCTYIGAAAGYTNKRDYRLYISQNQGAKGTLIYGEFDNKYTNISERLECQYLDIINGRNTLVLNQEFATQDESFEPNDESWYSTYIGSKSGENQTSTSKYNVGVGMYSLRNSTGEYNVSVGYGSGISLEAGGFNTILGSNALSKLESGSQNVAIGDRAGFEATTSTGSIYLGYRAGYSNNQNNRLFIDNSSTSAPLNIWRI